MESPIQQLIDILTTSPSVELLRSKNRVPILTFFVETFTEDHKVQGQEVLFQRLSDFIETQHLEEEESEATFEVLFDEKAKHYIRNWLNKGFLTNYQDEQGEVYYELSSHSVKVIDWLWSLKKEEYIGTESKFSSIFHQLKELVEFTNEDREERLQLLEQRKASLQEQIDKLKRGEEVQVYEEYQIVPRFNQLTQQAKELLSDFKEVEDNFKEITKEIYQKHSGEQTKDAILEFTFDALDQLKNSPQGKSFYAFFEFLVSRQLQEEWEVLIRQLYEALQEKDIPIKDYFLRGMRGHLYHLGRRVDKANDKMAEKLSRIIRENNATDNQATKHTIKEIKDFLISLSRKQQIPTVSFEIETDVDIQISFDRRLTDQKKEQATYQERFENANTTLSDAVQLDKLFSDKIINKELIREHIRKVLQEQGQISLATLINANGGLKKGLTELIAYFAVATEGKYVINNEKMQDIIFDTEHQKRIQFPEIIISL